MLKISYIMHENRITNAELSRRTGIKRQTIGRVLNGDLPPYPKYKRLFSEALNWPAERADELFTHIEVKQ